MIFGLVVCKEGTLDVLNSAEVGKCNAELMGVFDWFLADQPLLVVDEATYDAWKDVEGFSDCVYWVVGNDETKTWHDNKTYCGYDKIPFIVHNYNLRQMTDPTIIVLGNAKLLDSFKLISEMWYRFYVPGDVQVSVTGKLPDGFIPDDKPVTNVIGCLSLTTGPDNIPEMQYVDAARETHELFDMYDRNPTGSEILTEMLPEEVKKEYKDLLGKFLDKRAYFVDQCIRGNITEKGYGDNLSILVEGLKAYRLKENELVAMLTQMNPRSDLTHEEHHRYFVEGMKEHLLSVYGTLKGVNDPDCSFNFEDVETEWLKRNPK